MRNKLGHTSRNFVLIASTDELSSKYLRKNRQQSSVTKNLRRFTRARDAEKYSQIQQFVDQQVAKFRSRQYQLAERDAG